MDCDALRRLFDMTDRVVLVTGGTRGIGRALAEGYVAAGAASLQAMSERGRTRFAAVMPRLAAMDADTLFEFVVDRTIAGLVPLLDG